MSKDSEQQGNAASPRKQVAIFGGGIAGLTAAHELVERGFLVEVFERNEPSGRDQMLGTPCALGGMARSQWARVERNDPFGPAPTPNNIEATELKLVLDAPAERGSPIPRWRILFQPGTADYAKPLEAVATIHEVATRLARRPEIRVVEVRGYANDKSLTTVATDALTTRLDRDRATKVADALRAELTGLKTEREVKPYGLGLGHAGDWSVPDAERDYVGFHVLENWLPGEHGFRYFPAFYRHVFDTMRRIPIPDDHDPTFSETARTVLDNIVPVPFMGLATREATQPFPFLVRPQPSLRLLFDQLKGMLESTGSTLEDIRRFQLKLFKFATSCAKRRESYEDMSWHDFLDADRFSKEFQCYLDGGGEALLSMQSRACDARSFGNASVQILASMLDPHSRPDGTLNAPTSIAWFDPWRRYLENQGVLFRRGELKGFYQPVDGPIWPIVFLYESDADKPVKTVLTRDYYVLAVGPKDLQDVVPDGLFVGEDFYRVRHFNLGDPTKATTGGALEHMSGIQYYFENDFSVLAGHFLFPETAYRLSAIFQPQFWMQKRGWWSGYRGVLSVDISNWHKPHNGVIGWECTKPELAANVLQQVRQGFGLLSEVKGQNSQAQAPANLLRGLVLPTPLYFHIDDDIQFGRSGKPSLNRSPFLMTRPGEYRKRPGKPGDYGLYDGYVIAGVFMQTHMRLTTMEAANESGRHAANAILRKEGFGTENCDDPTSPRGELARIFNPEDHEPPDLCDLKTIDEQLYERGLPHLVEILNLDEVPDSLLQPDADLQRFLNEADGPLLTLDLSPNPERE